MPRRNKPVKRTAYQQVNNDALKTRYTSKHAAEKAVEIRMLQNMNLELSVYQGLDGGWYMTSSSQNK